MTTYEKLDVDELWKSLNQFGKFQLFHCLFILWGWLFHPFYIISVVFIVTCLSPAYGVNISQLIRYDRTCPSYDDFISRGRSLTVKLMTQGYTKYKLNIYGYQPSFRCEVKNHSEILPQDWLLNDTYRVTYEECHINIYRNDTNNTIVKTLPCANGYSYDLPIDRSFVTEWDLVCDKSGLSELSTMMMMVGKGIGAFVIPPLTDKFGRLKLHWLSSVGAFTFSVGMSFCQNIIQFIVLQVFLGFMQHGAGVSGYVYLLEFFPQNSRMYVEMLTMFFWTTGILIFGLLAYLLQNLSWRYLHVTMTLGSVHVLIMYCVLSESVRWLLANGKREEAEKIIKKAARWNMVNFETVIKKSQNKANELDSMLIQTDLSVKEVFEPSVKKYTMLDILKNKRIFLNSLIVWYIWITVAFGYYGLTLTSSSTLSGDRFLNFVLIAIAEYPVLIVEYFLMNRIGRKKLCIVFAAIAAVSLLTATIMTSTGVEGTAALVFFLVGKFAVTGSFSVVFLYTPELYPTNLRNVGMGTASGLECIGSMMAPFTGLLANYVLWGPGTIFGSMFVFVTCLVYFLPETNRQQLPTTIEELQEWHKNKDTNKSLEEHI